MGMDTMAQVVRAQPMLTEEHKIYSRKQILKMRKKKKVIIQGMKRKRMNCLFMIFIDLESVDSLESLIKVRLMLMEPKCMEEVAMVVVAMAAVAMAVVAMVTLACKADMVEETMEELHMEEQIMAVLIMVADKAIKEQIMEVDKVTKVPITKEVSKDHLQKPILEMKLKVTKSQK